MKYKTKNYDWRIVLSLVIFACTAIFIIYQTTPKNKVDIGESLMIEQKSKTGNTLPDEAPEEN